MRLGIHRSQQRATKLVPFVSSLVLSVVYLISLLPGTAHAQETSDQAIQAARAVYSGTIGTGVELLPTCHPTVTAATNAAGTVIREHAKDTVTEYCFDPEGHLRFVFIITGEDRERFYYSVVSGFDHQYPSLCRYIGPSGSMLEGEQLTDVRTDPRADALERYHRSLPYCEQLRQYAEMLTSLAGSKQQPFVPGPYDTVYVDHLAEEKAAFSEEEIAEFEASGEPYNACWEETTVLLRAGTTDTVSVRNSSGCDPGCMLYTTQESQTLYSASGQKQTERQAQLVFDFAGAGPDGLPYQRLWTESTSRIFEQGQPALLVEEVRMNELLLKYKLSVLR